MFKRFPQWLLAGLAACEAAPVEVGQLLPSDAAEAPAQRPDAALDNDSGPNPDAGPTPASQWAPTFADNEEDPIAEVSVSETEICVRRTEGRVWCWSRLVTFLGTDEPRTLYAGDGPREIALPGPAERMFDSVNGTCARLADQRFFCWGRVSEDPFSPSQSFEYIFRASVAYPPGEVVDLRGADAVAGFCVLRGGTVECLTSSVTADWLTPVAERPFMAIVGPHRDYEALWHTGFGSQCARRRNGAVDCWENFNESPPTEVDLFRGASVVVGAGAIDTECALVAGLTRCRARTANFELDWPQLPFVGLAATLFSVAFCGVSSDGRIGCWGENLDGALGRGSFEAAGWMSIEPALLSDPVTGLIGGPSGLCALTVAGALVCWGDNTSGQIQPGVGWVDRPTAIASAAGLSEFAVGYDRACGTDGQGDVYCWGQTPGSLRCEPEASAVGFHLGEPVVGLWTNGSDVCGAAADRHLICAELSRAERPGELGPLSPITGLEVAARDTVVMSGSDTCVAQGDRLKCFTLTDGEGTPVVREMLLPAPVRAMAANYYSACVLEDDGRTRCAANRDPGPLDAALRDAATLFPSAPGRRALALHDWRVCVIDEDATRCTDVWAAEVPAGGATVEEIATPPGAVALVLGRRHGCFLTDAGSVWCWGGNDVGQLGTGEPLTTTHDDPVQVPGLEGISRLAALGDHTCALDRDGVVYCWGDNPGGVAGREPMCAVPSPTRLVGP